MDVLKTYYNEQTESQPQPSLTGIKTRISEKSKSKTLRTSIFIAAVVASLTVTALAANVLPGFIKSLQAGEITTNEYESGMLPHQGVDPNSWGVKTIGEVIQNDHVIEKLDSLYEAQELLGAPLLVPTYLEYGEEPLIIRNISSATGNMADIYYFYGYIEQPSGVIVNPGGAFFILNQEYVGDQSVIWDIDTGILGKSSEVKINDFDAIWVEGSKDSRQNGTLYWIQNGVYISIAPCDLDFDYVIKIAESLAPLE